MVKAILTLIVAWPTFLLVDAFVCFKGRATWSELRAETRIGQALIWAARKPRLG
jgi:hypothetical protein